MPSIVNGLFSGRSGISSHGTAIAVVGDNISNSSTIGYKTSRSEFQDLIAGGQASGKVVGSGSSIASVSNIFEQGTLEFSGRPLDLAVDGNGLFVVANGAQRYYTRAGNFRIDEKGFIVNQNGYNVLGFPDGGSGALEELSVNTVSQSQVATTEATIAGNVNAASDTILPAAIPTVTAAGANPPALEANEISYAQLNNASDFSTVMDVFDGQGGAHTITFFFFHTGQNQYTVRGYVNSQEVDTTTPPNPDPVREGYPRFIGTKDLIFDPNGTRSNLPAAGTADMTLNVTWNNGAAASSVKTDFSEFTQYASATNISSIAQNGKGIGTVGSISIEKNGDIYALLNNGQAAIIGTIGLVNFSNPEGLVRMGGTLLQQSPRSGEPVIGKPKTGTFGAVQSGSLELSTVDIANEFVKLITLQRGFQANSRIITTINQLLNDIIQLA